MPGAVALPLDSRRRFFLSACPCSGILQLSPLIVESLIAYQSPGDCCLHVALLSHPPLGEDAGVPLEICPYAFM